MSSNEYLRDRRRAIREGTWNPRRTTEPTLTPTPLDWAWAAGFIEGEGSIMWRGTTPCVTASQKDREALDRLLALFGGTVRQQVVGRKSPIFAWSVYGDKARVVIQGIYPMLTARRRDQADSAFRGE